MSDHGYLEVPTTDFSKESITKKYRCAPLLGEPASTEFRAALDEITRLRAKLQEIEGYLGGGKDNAVQAARMVVDELNEKRAQLERARKGVAELNRFAKERKFDTGYLASNPPQNPVAYELGWRTKELLRELENGGGE